METSFIGKNMVGKKLIDVLNRAEIKMILINKGNKGWCIGAMITDPAEAMKIGMMLGRADLYGEISTQYRVDASGHSVPQCVIFHEAKAAIGVH